MLFNTIMLQAGGPAGGGMIQVLFLVGMFVVMYFFMLRPQAKRAKEQKKFADSMTAGEYVITTAGIHGTIQRANEDGTLMLEIARGMVIKIERQAISMETTAAYRKKNETAATVVAAK